MRAPSQSFSTAALTGALVAAVAATSIGVATAGEEEKCYGIALKGTNDCAGGYHACAGYSMVDYDGRSFKLVPKGTCTSMQTPFGPGSLEPIKRPS